MGMGSHVQGERSCVRNFNWSKVYAPEGCRVNSAIRGAAPRALVMILRLLRMPRREHAMLGYQHDDERRRPVHGAAEPAPEVSTCGIQELQRHDRGNHNDGDLLAPQTEEEEEDLCW